jgi:hypothetical protein
MNIDDMAQALQVLEQSGASPEIKAKGHQILTEIMSKGASAAHAERRAQRWLKYGIGWAVLIGFCSLFIVALGHTLGIWTIERPEQLPWVWGGALTLAVTGTQYLLRVFFPKPPKPK